MVGLIPNLLLKLIQSAAGPEAVAKVLERAGLSPDFRFAINRAYPQEVWQRLYAAALEVLHIDQEEAESLYAEFFVRDALARFPRWFQMCRNSYEFLCLQPKIHNAFATGLTDPAERKAMLDKFCMRAEANRVFMVYRSANRLCGLYIKLVRQIASHYGDDVDIEEPECAKRAGDCCRIEVTWRKLAHV